MPATTSSPKEAAAVATSSLDPLDTSTAKAPIFSISAAVRYRDALVNRECGRSRTHGFMQINQKHARSVLMGETRSTEEWEPALTRKAGMTPAETELCGFALRTRLMDRAIQEK